MQVDLSSYRESGLYLLFPSGEKLTFTHQMIEASTRTMLEDPERIPAHMRAAIQAPACAICPKRCSDQICHTVIPVFPLIDDLHHFFSFNEVTAIYVEKSNGTAHLRDTTMQEALKFIAFLSLMDYCEIGRKYTQYFEGVNPLSGAECISREVFKNIFVDHAGDRSKIDQTIRDMQRELLATTRCQTKRLQLICEGDAICNAFAATQVAVEFMIFAIEDYDLACV